MSKCLNNHWAQQPTLEEWRWKQAWIRSPCCYLLAEVGEDGEEGFIWMLVQSEFHQSKWITLSFYSSYSLNLPVIQYKWLMLSFFHPNPLIFQYRTTLHEPHLIWLFIFACNVLQQSTTCPKPGGLFTRARQLKKRRILRIPGSQCMSCMWEEDGVLKYWIQ